MKLHQYNVHITIKLVTDRPSFQLLPVIKKFAEKAALILSSISCFSGGILLGVCFVDMIPEAM